MIWSRAIGLAILCILLATGCGSSPAVDLPVVDLAPHWQSQAPAGVLGTLQLDLTRQEQSHVFDAVLRSSVNAQLNNVVGVGTQADGHLILDFAGGTAGEFYFQGTLELENNAPVRIAGSFVFPDQRETLDAVFVIL